METCFDLEWMPLVERLGSHLMANQLLLGVAESCTGGLLAKILTDLPGASNWFEAGFVTYSNRIKETILGVSSDTLLECGAVSESVAYEMSLGVLACAKVQLSIAITGIAGPGGANSDKPLGMVCFAWGFPGNLIYTDTQYFQGNREAIRNQAAKFALLEFDGLLKTVIRAHCS